MSDLPRGYPTINFQPEWWYWCDTCHKPIEPIGGGYMDILITCEKCQEEDSQS